MVVKNGDLGFGNTAWTFHSRLSTLKGMKKSRREFLKSAATAGAAFSALPLLTRCVSLDQWMMGDTHDEREKVVILGAGAAGLSAAYLLNKANVPYRVFESSSRIGGRLLTVQDVNPAGQWVDLGADRILSTQAHLLELCRELKLDLREFAPPVPTAFYQRGHFVPTAEWEKISAELITFFARLNYECYKKSNETLNAGNASQFPLAVQLDSVTAHDLLDKNKKFLNDIKLAFLENAVRAQLGVELKDLSGLGLLHWMRDTRPLSRVRHYKLSGGFGGLTQALYDRVGGIIPGRLVQFNYRLKEIAVKDNYYRLSFATDRGTEEYKAKTVICTLPWAILSGIDGVKDLPWSDRQLLRLGQTSLGTQSKVALSFSSRYWKESILDRGGTWVTDLASGAISEGSVPPVVSMGGGRGILCGQIGGLAGRKVGLDSKDQALKDLAQIRQRDIPEYDQNFYVQNWSLLSNFKGSRAVPGLQFYQAFERAPMVAGSWFMAGEAHSLNQLGTVAGAVESASRVVNQIFRSQRV
jgi:monoamine oxidase